MGLIGSFLRLVAGLVIFVVVLALGIIFSPQLASALGNVSSWPGTITVGNVQIPLLASIVASLVLTIIINAIAIPFRSRS